MDFPAATPGKILNEARKAEGLGPPFHCEFDRCAGAGEDETKYCRRHRCQWYSPGDNMPCKRAGIETAFGRSHFAYCLTHKCRNMDCGSARQGPMAYCAGHMCRMPDCRGGSEHNPPSAPMYCAEHECVSVGCRRRGRWPAEEAPVAPGTPGEDGGVVPSSSDATPGSGMGYCSQHARHARHARRVRPPPRPKKRKFHHGCCTS